MVLLSPHFFRLLGAAAFGALLSLAFPDTGWWLTAPLAIAGLYALVRTAASQSSKHPHLWAGLYGWVFSSVFFLIHLTFANYAVGIVPWVLLAVAEGLAIAATCAAWSLLQRQPWIADRAGVHAISFAALFTAGEWLRSNFPFGGFPWGRLAFSQSESPLGRLAWLGGAPLVSLVTCAIGVLLAQAAIAFFSKDFARRRATITASTAVSVAIVVGLSGFLIPLSSAPETGTLKIGGVQGNVSKPGLHAFDNQREVLDNHLAGTHALAGRGVDVVIWPENGTDIDPEVDPAVAADIEAAADAAGAPILVGTIQYPAPGIRLNTSLMWVPGVGPVARYDKMHPVPFAEYIPLRPIARRVTTAVDLVSTDMTAGTKLGVLPLDSDRLGRTVQLGTVICFEIVVDAQVTGTIRAGAEFLAVQTNNASFGFTAESTQQLAMTRFRAIETGRATAQISTVGVSGIYAPDGSELARTGHFTAEQLVATVPLRTSLTPAVRWGNEITAVICVSAGVLLAAGIGFSFMIRRGRRRRGHGEYTV